MIQTYLHFFLHEHLKHQFHEHCNYGIEADCPEDAEACAREFCADDYPDVPVAKVHVELVDYEHMAELAEYEKIARVNPYCI